MQPARDEKYAARALGVSPHCMQAWRKRGDGPAYYKYGARVVYYDDDLEAFKEASRRTSTSEVAA